ncbi:MAG: HAD-IA family hydrolase [Nanoarchaeota archaeon]|nr:HAD-IA family hydrolase [Nanoarchaeota archaeon]
MKVILDAMGVIFHEEDDLVESFMPYLEENAIVYGECSKRQVIESTYLRLSKGELNSDQFFRDLRIKNPNLDFLLNVTLDEEFARFMNQHPNKLTVLSNDSQEWANYRNGKLGFDFPYITSSLLGVRKPDRKAYEKICWALNEAPENCVYVDNLESNLHAPHSLGMNVVLFRRDGRNNSPFPITRNFSELNQYLRGK